MNHIDSGLSRHRAGAALAALSLLFGLAFPFLAPGLAAPAPLLLKGAGVALLALAAAALPPRGHWWLATIMAAGSAGDMLLELPGGLMIGGASFALGHVIAMVFYTRQRSASRVADRLVAAALIGWGLAMPSLLLPAGAPLAMVTLYAVLLCGMAATALLSRFPRWLTGLGALLFVVSDTLLVMRLGGRVMGGAEAHGLAVWISYYLGQFLIFAGIALGLVRASPAGA